MEHRLQELLTQASRLRCAVTFDNFDEVLVMRSTVYLVYAWNVAITVVPAIVNRVVPVESDGEMIDAKISVEIPKLKKEHEFYLSQLNGQSDSVEDADFHSNLNRLFIDLEPAIEYAESIRLTREAHAETIYGFFRSGETDDEGYA